MAAVLAALYIVCHGLALVLLPGGHWQAWVFVLAMLLGMLLFQRLEARQRG